MKLNKEKSSNIINNSNLPLQSFTFLPVPRGGSCGLCTANSCQTQHCLLLKICLLRIWCLHVFLELLHEYFLQKQFIHKVLQIIRKSVTSSFKTWPTWSGACSHSTLCCRGTAGETELTSHFWLGQSHLGYWTHKALNITSERKHFFRDLLWKANARLLSISATLQRQPARTVPEQSQRALTLWTHETHPSSAPQLPFACCGNLETASLVQYYGNIGFSCLPKAERGAKKNQILVLLNVYFTHCCWDMSQGHHAQPHSKWWRPEDTAPVIPSPFFFWSFLS